MNYQGKNIFITGGSEGIGKAIAKLLTGKGANTFIFSRNPKKITKALKEIRKNKISKDQICEGISLDVTKLNIVKTKFSTLFKKYGNIDILINTAGFAAPGYFEKIPPETFHDMMEVNYFGIVNTITAAFPFFVKNNGGHIVNTSSLSGFLPVFGYSGYTASKYAVIGFSEVLKSEFKRHNIKVSVLCPPDTDTPGFKKENKTKPAETVEISKGAKLMTPKQVAESFEKAFSKNKFMIIPGLEGKLAYRVKRFFPGLLNFIFNMSIKKVQKKQRK